MTQAISNDWMEAFFSQEYLAIILLDERGIPLRQNHKADQLLPVQQWLQNPPTPFVPFLVSIALNQCVQFIPFPIHNESSAQMLLVGTPTISDSAYQELAALNTRKNYFWSFAAHEMRNPISAIFAWSELIQGNMLSTKEEIQEGMNIMYSESMRLTKLLNKMLNFFRLETDPSPASPTPISTTQLMQKLEQAVLTQAKQKKVTLFFEESVSDARILGEVQTLTLALQCLLENAIDYSTEGSEVTVAVSADSKAWTITMEDSAGGIAPEILPHLQQPYHLPLDKHKGHGLGLGIPTANEIIQRHRGTLAFEPTEHGTRVTVSLPVAVAPSLA